MVRSWVLVAVATLCGISAAFCQSSPSPARGGTVEDHDLKPPPLNPVEVPGWMSRAVDNILSGKATLPDDDRTRKQ